MPQPRFDRLSERLLCAGIAPRHVRRYVRELGDHFDDLVLEEQVGGARCELAETRALTRLGNDDNLAEAMLSRATRSLTARFPWAVFGLGPIAMLVLGVVAALGIEVGLLYLISAAADAIGLEPNAATAKWGTLAFTGYNMLAVYAAPLGFAALIYLVGSRQRMPRPWIVTGVSLTCILGGLQNLVFYDTGVRHGGVLVLQSALLSPFPHLTQGAGLFSPFPHVAEGLARAAANLAIAGCFWWLSTRKKSVGRHRAFAHRANIDARTAGT